LSYFLVVNLFLQRICKQSLDLINKIGKPFDAKEKEVVREMEEKVNEKKNVYITRKKVVVVYKSSL